ncbi:LAFE_0G16050g1_1 [Lachancea fermentati]|uniref:LAFE_0G16050g1_1 n=1 Tax=Lachancea fermentati TaxID=4955 RepID=A0A1G4MIH3_LACFM|nr:LAFE_0G16050g1_1 [Lachancea fermentati]
MSFVPIICGKRDWDVEYAQSQEYNAIYCPNCHNYKVRPVKRREFITIWFIPVMPFFWGKQLVCPICNWRQDFKSDEQLKKVLREQDNIRAGKVGG